MAETKPKVTLIQSTDGQVRRVRIDGREMAVLSAGPTLISGRIGVSLTLMDVDLDAEAAATDTAVSSA